MLPIRTQPKSNQGPVRLVHHRHCNFAEYRLVVLTWTSREALRDKKWNRASGRYKQVSTQGCRNVLALISRTYDESKHGYESISTSPK